MMMMMMMMMMLILLLARAAAAAAQTQEYEGVSLSALGGCAVDTEEAPGVWMKPSRMSLEQMEAELRAAGLKPPEGTRRRTAFTTMIKARATSGGAGVCAA
jgi:hypothetical protein